MSAILTGIFHTFGMIIGLVLIVMFILYICNFGIKHLIEKISGVFSFFKHDKVKHILAVDNKDTLTMTPINLVKGTCDRCGKSFVSTSEEEANRTSPVLVSVTYQGVTRNICNDCAKKIMEVFSDTSESDEVIMSDNVKSLKTLFNK